MTEIIQRAWGTYEVLAEGPRYKVKRLIMAPGQQFSLQYHHHRSEVWTIVAGTATVVCSARVRQMFENEVIQFGVGEKHKLSNPGQIPLAVIEVQYGSYLGEDDIVRLD